MKQLAFGLVSMTIIIFLLVIYMTMHGRELRQSEAEHALTEAVDSAVSGLMEGHGYSVDTKEEFASEFLQILSGQLNSTSDVRVSVLEADEKLGTLSVEITETYKHPNGQTGTVSQVRTVVFEQEQEEEEAFCTVSFYAEEDELYKEYQLPEQAVCALPAPPEQEGKTFFCWRFISGGAGNIFAGSALTVTEDISLEAVFH